MSTDNPFPISNDVLAAHRRHRIGGREVSEEEGVAWVRAEAERLIADVRTGHIEKVLSGLPRLQEELNAVSEEADFALRNLRALEARRGEVNRLMHLTPRIADVIGPDGKGIPGAEDWGLDTRYGPRLRSRMRPDLAHFDKLRRRCQYFISTLGAAGEERTWNDEAEEIARSMKQWRRLHDELAEQVDELESRLGIRWAVVRLYDRGILVERKRVEHRELLGGESRSAAENASPREVGLWEYRAGQVHWIGTGQALAVVLLHLPVEGIGSRQHSKRVSAYREQIVLPGRMKWESVKNLMSKAESRVEEQNWAYLAGEAIRIAEALKVRTS